MNERMNEKGWLVLPKIGFGYMFFFYIEEWQKMWMSRLEHVKDAILILSFSINL